MAIVAEGNMNSTSELTKGCVADVVTCLSAGEMERAIAILDEMCVIEDSSNIVDAVKKFLTCDTSVKNSKVFQCVQNILVNLAQKATPENLLLEFIELGEEMHDNTVMVIILKPLQIVLDRLSGERGFSLMWCLSMLEHYVRKLPVPKNHNLEGEETMLLDCDANVDCIVNLYKLIEPFYSHFVSQVTAEISCSTQKPNGQIIRERKFLIRSIIVILGQPLVQVNIRHNGAAKNESRIIAENLVTYLSHIVANLLKFLEYSEVDVIRHSKKATQDLPKTEEDALNEPIVENVSSELVAKEILTDLFEADDEIPVLGLGTLYYLIFTEHFCEESLPCIYNPLYIFHRGLYLSTELLKCAEFQIIYKGLVLARAVIAKVPESYLSTSFAETEVHSNFVDSLQPVIVYCPSEEYRVLAVKVFHMYLSILDRKCLYLLLIYMQKTAQECVIIGYLITYMKDIVLKEMDRGSRMSPYFKGRMLQILFAKYCELSDGSETDLIQNMSKITASLNFIRFMVIRDRGNTTGFLDYVPHLKKFLLNPITEAIKLSRAHYQLKLTEEQEKQKKKQKSDTNGELEMSVTVSGKVVQHDAISTIECSLTYFDLIESLLCRVNECIESL